MLVTGSKLAVWYVTFAPGPDQRYIQTYVSTGQRRDGSLSFREGWRTDLPPHESDGNLVLGPKLYANEHALVIYVSALSQVLLLTPRGLGWVFSSQHVVQVTA